MGITPEELRGAGGGLERVLHERGPVVLRVWERLAASGPAEVDTVRAAIAELLAAPGELAPPGDPLVRSPLAAGSALTAAARAAFPALVRGMALLPVAVRELARALGSPLALEDAARLGAAVERVLAAAARIHAEACRLPGR
jgi:hypothetical protein